MSYHDSAHHDANSQHNITSHNITFILLLAEVGWIQIKVGCILIQKAVMVCRILNGPSHGQRRSHDSKSSNGWCRSHDSKSCKGLLEFEWPESVDVCRISSHLNCWHTNGSRTQKQLKSDGFPISQNTILHHTSHHNTHYKTKPNTKPSDTHAHHSVVALCNCFQPHLDGVSASTSASLVANGLTLFYLRFLFLKKGMIAIALLLHAYKSKADLIASVWRRIIASGSCAFLLLIYSYRCTQLSTSHHCRWPSWLSLCHCEVDVILALTLPRFPK